MSDKCILVGQSGGPTTAINSSLAGVIAAGVFDGTRIEGMRYGIQGFLEGRSVRLDEAFVSRVDIELLRNTPASWLGSCRYKLPLPSEDEATYERLFQRFEEIGAEGVLYIGGNDSMDTIAKLSEYGRQIGSDIRFIGVPKTIDNDLVGTDHTPGYGSAARFVATAVNEIAYDANVYDLKSVTFVEIMGRDAGWLAASSALALAAPDLVLLPEAPLDLDVLMERIASILDEKNTVMVGVSLGCKTRSVELSTLQRCASYAASRVDLDEAFDLGHAGFNAALAGETGKMCAVERVSNDPYSINIQLVDVVSVANKVKNVPREWIAEDGMSVTKELLDYMKPLVGELPAQMASLD